MQAAPAPSPAPATPPPPAAAVEGGAPPPPARPHWRGLRQPAALAGLVVAGCAYAYVVDPNGSTLFPPCPLHATTGLDCPLCGGTRAVHALLHGDVARALDHNVLFVLALPLLLVAFGAWALRRAGYAAPRVWRPWMRWGLLGVLVAFLVVRNLPVDALHYLDARA